MPQASINNILPLNFGAGERETFQNFARQIEQQEKVDAQEFFSEFTHSNSPVWMRYSQAIYNHPKTWWIGLIQLSMLSGTWGERNRRAAALRQSTLSQIIKRYFSTRSHRDQLLDAEKIITYSLKHNKAEVMGRLHGGIFTNYAATGGSYRNRLTTSITVPAAAVNFTIASFGACIEAVSKGYRSYGTIAQSVLIGRPKYFPEIQLQKKSPSSSDSDTQASSEALLAQVTSVYHINDLHSGPVLTADFCARPENKNLKRVCD